MYERILNLCAVAHSSMKCTYTPGDTEKKKARERKIEKERKKQKGKKEKKGTV